MQAHLLMTHRSLAHPHLMLRLAVCSPIYTPSPSPYTHNTAVKHSLTQKCQGKALHLEAVVYNAL